MKKTDRLKSLIIQAIRESNDSSLSEIRFALKNSLNKLELIEKKKEKTIPQKTNQWQTVNGKLINPYAVKQTVDLIDDMIESEKENFKKKKEDNPSFLMGD